MILLITLYQFIPLLVTITVLIQSHSCVKHFKLKILCSYETKLRPCMVFNYVKKILNIPLFMTFARTQGR